jgi:hypothetical protein
MVVGVEALMASWSEPASAPVDHLVNPPAENTVWLLGNSMMKTGIDDADLAARIGVDVNREFHGARYTDLWYLIVHNALPDIDEAPAVIVWGFRPHTASFPGLRFDASAGVQAFEVDGDAVFERLAQPDRTSPWIGARASGDIADTVRSSAIWAARDTAGSRLDDATRDLAILLLEPLAAGTADLIDERVRDGNRSLADVMIWLSTDGAVSDAEELVDDLAADHLTGPKREFDDSFIPLIASKIDDLGLRQLVLIYPQREAAAGNRSVDDEAFVAAARAWFEAEGIDYIDLYSDSRFVVDDFGGGDHLGESGRVRATGQVAARLEAMGISGTAP